MAWFSRRKPPDDHERPSSPLAERLRELEHRCSVLERDLADLSDRYRRRAARYRKAGEELSEEAGPADGPAAPAAPVRKNGLPTLAQLRAQGRLPW